MRVPTGTSAAAAVLLSGVTSLRDTPLSGSPRAPYCMMGICFECLAEIDGVANRQSCMVTAQPGMRIRRQPGRRGVDPAAGLHGNLPSFPVPKPRSGGA